MTEEKTTDVLKTPTYKDKLFGRMWKVSVLIPKSKSTTEGSALSEYTEYILSSSNEEDKALRVTFSIERKYGVALNMSEIIIYNLNPEMENLIIENGYRVRVEAGYVNGKYGLICDSTIYQPMWEREDNVTTKLTLLCVDCLNQIHDNWIIDSSPQLQYQRKLVATMAKKARKSPITLNDSDISPNAANARMPRGVVVLENAMDYIRRYCQLSGTLPTVVNNKIVLHRMQDPLSAEAKKNMIVVTAGKGGSLIGVPQQTEKGATFTCLLNPEITVVMPPNVIKIDNSFLRQLKLQYGKTAFYNFDQDWTYSIVGVTHAGDTRGNEWYSNVVAINRNLVLAEPTIFDSPTAPMK